MVEAVWKVLKERIPYLPLTVRSIHYAILNDPPLIHTSKPRSTYKNDIKSYKALVDLLTRMRIAGDIPMDWIDDETRPVTIWDVHDNSANSVNEQLGRFLHGYNANLMQSQPHHCELLGEKNTCRSGPWAHSRRNIVSR